jgi:hypothetical protein
LEEHTASIFRTDDRWSMFFWNVGTVLKPKDQLWHHLTSSGSVIKLVKKMKVISNFWKALKFYPTFDIYILFSGIYLTITFRPFLQVFSYEFHMIHSQCTVSQ